MKTRSLLFLLTLCISQTAISQTIKQIIFSTGGSFMSPGNKVKVYSYNPLNSIATVFDSIYGDFSNEVIVDSGFAYVHAGRASGSSFGEDVIIKYNLNTHQRVDSITDIAGTQKFIITPSHLVVMRGYGASSGYVQFYNKTTLDLVHNDLTLPYMTAAATYLNDSVYVGFNKNDTGSVAIYSMDPPQRHRIIHFDTLSAGVNSMKNDGSSIYMLGERFNMINFTVDYGSLTRYTPVTAARTTELTDAANGLISIINDSIIGELGSTNAYRISSTPMIPYSYDLQSTYTDGAYDAGANVFYVMETDYFSYGRMAKYDRITGALLSFVNTDIAGAAIDIDYFGTPLQVADEVKKELNIFPNPTTGKIFFNQLVTGEVRIHNISGALMFSGQMNANGQLDISSLSPGIYVLTVQNEEGIRSHRIVKQ